MEKIVLNKRIVNDNGLVSEEIYISKEISKHPKNKNIKLKVGWMANDVNKCDDNDDCDEASTLGHYECISGNCVFIPL